MGDPPRTVHSKWERVRAHAVVRAAVVYCSALFFVLQVLDVLGASASTIRTLAIVAVAAFVLGEGVYLWRSLRPPSAAHAPERLRKWIVSGRRWVPATAILLFLGAVAWLIGRNLIRSPVRPGTDVIAVLPFVASGDDVEDFSIGMVSLLTTNLDQIEGVRVIDAGTVLHGWNRRASGGTLDLEGALQVGRDVGAGAILRGTLSSMRDAVQLTAEIYTVDGQRVAQREERGQVDQLQALVDRLSVQLLRDIWRSDAPVPDLRIAAITTEQPQALREFLHGERYFRAGRYDSAIVAFEEAVRVDTTFALAYFRLSETYGWAQHIGAPDALHAAESATRFGARLPERERSLALAQLLHEQGDFAALDSVSAVTRRHPDDAMAWYLLGDVLWHSLSILQPPYDSLIAPFRRAVALDPTPSGGMIHVLEEALYRGDRALFDEFLAHYRTAAGPDRTARWEHLARLRWSPPDSLLPRIGEVAGQLIAERVPASYMGRLQSIISVRFATEMELDVDQLIVAAQRGRTLSPEAAVGALQFLPSALAETGRVREASVLLDTAAAYSAQSGSPPPPILRILWSIAGLYPADSVDAQLALLALYPAFPKSAVPLLLRQFHLARGDLRAADTISLTLPDVIPRDMAEAFASALEAWELQVRGDADSAVALMRSAIRNAGYAGNALRFFRSGPLFAHAVALSKQPVNRAEGVRRLREFLSIGSNFTVPAWFALAEALEAEGDLAGAAGAYAHVLRIWKYADPHLQPHVLRAREALARLTRER